MLRSRHINDHVIVWMLMAVTALLHLMSMFSLSLSLTISLSLPPICLALSLAAAGAMANHLIPNALLRPHGTNNPYNTLLGESAVYNNPLGMYNTQGVQASSLPCRIESSAFLSAAEAARWAGLCCCPATEQKSSLLYHKFEPGGLFIAALMGKRCSGVRLYCENPRRVGFRFCLFCLRGFSVSGLRLAARLGASLSTGPERAGRHPRFYMCSNVVLSRQTLYGSKRNVLSRSTVILLSSVLPLPGAEAAVIAHQSKRGCRQFVRVYKSAGKSCKSLL